MSAYVHHQVEVGDGPPPHIDTTYSYADTVTVYLIGADSIGIEMPMSGTKKFQYTSTNFYKDFVYGGSGYGTNYEATFKPGSDSLIYKVDFGLNTSNLYISSDKTFLGRKE